MCRAVHSGHGFTELLSPLCFIYLAKQTWETALRQLWWNYELVSVKLKIHGRVPIRTSPLLQVQANLWSEEPVGCLNACVETVFTTFDMNYVRWFWIFWKGDWVLITFIYLLKKFCIYWILWILLTYLSTWISACSPTSIEHPQQLIFDCMYFISISIFCSLWQTVRAKKLLIFIRIFKNRDNIFP